MKIAVGSKNPVKIKAVEEAFKKVFGDCEVVSKDVNSGVSHQPFGEEEAIKGAINRARAALKECEADFGVGLEGAVREVAGKGYFETPWCAVLDNKGKIGLGSAGSMELPEKAIIEIKKGKELGEVIDEFSGIENSKQKMGAFGYFTNGVVDRQSAYVQMVVFALARFLKQELYDK